MFIAWHSFRVLANYQERRHDSEDRRMISRSERAIKLYEPHHVQPNRAKKMKETSFMIYWLLLFILMHMSVDEIVQCEP